MLAKCRNICEDSCFREGKKGLFLCFYLSYMTLYFSFKISFWTYIGGSFSLGVMISGPCLGLLLVATTIVSRSMTNHTVTSGNNSSISCKNAHPSMKVPCFPFSVLTSIMVQRISFGLPNQCRFDFVSPRTRICATNYISKIPKTYEIISENMKKTFKTQ